MHVFILTSNKNLLLPNYYVQSSINYIIENIYTASIDERLRVFRSLEFKISGRSNLTLSALQTIRHYFNIFASIPVCVALAL